MLMLKILVFILLLIIAGLIIRYKLYPNWQLFLDDLFDLLTLGFLPGPLRPLVGVALVVWGVSWVVTRFTGDLRSTGPVAQAPPNSSFSDLMKAAGSESGKEDPQPEGAGSPPPAPPEGALSPPPSAPPGGPPQNPGGLPQDPSAGLAGPTPTPGPEQTPGAEQTRTQPVQPTPEPSPAPVVVSPSPSPSPTPRETPAPAPAPTSTPAATPKLISVSDPPRLVAESVPTVTNAEAGTSEPPRLAAPPPAAVGDVDIVNASLGEPAALLTPTPASGPEYYIVVKRNGKSFVGRLTGERQGKLYFEQPSGHIVALPAAQIAEMREHAEEVN